MPLEIKAPGYPHSFVPLWQAALHSCGASQSNLEICYGTKIEPPLPQVINNQLDVQFLVKQRGGHDQWDPEPTTRQFDIMLSTRGFGTERTGVPNCPYIGFYFWQTDPFDNQNWGVNIGTPARILIAGGGDGALQDYIRLLTGRSPKEVYQALKVPPDTEAELQSAEDHAQRRLHLEQPAISRSRSRGSQAAT